MTKGRARAKADSSELSARDAVYAFEDTGYELEFLPLSARRALDAAGKKLGRVGWQSLSSAHRWEIVGAGARDEIDVDRVVKVIARAQPPAVDITPSRESRSLPDDIVSSLGRARSIDEAQWAKLRPIEQYALGHLAAKPEALATAYDEIVAPQLTHLASDGAARMVDVADKASTRRRAVARALVRMAPKVAIAIEQGKIPKGDVLAVARVAGIQAAKKTPELIPLCHHVALTRVEIAFEIDGAGGTVTIEATVEALDRTGVEMEALVAASTAALALYDMVKSADRWATIEQVALFEKSGGRSGDVRRADRAR
jgi:molybdenum cofactor biosynthesis protein MoaC